VTNNEFRHWLNGFFLLSGEDVTLNIKQLHVIRNHLNLAREVEGQLDHLNAAFLKRISEVLDSSEKDDPEIMSLLSQELRIHLQTSLSD